MLKITYGDKKYDNFKDALVDAVNNGVEKTIRERLNRQLEHLSDEINAEGGTISVKNEGNKIIINWEGFSDSLSERMETALNAE